jgi:putative acetyltransferase
VATIRDARVEDAPMLCAAEQEISGIPGLLVTQPDELLPQAFASLITTLADGSGCYLVAEDQGSIVGHAFLKPMDLRAVSHVFRLTIVVHHGHWGRGIGTAMMKALADWANDAPAVHKVELIVRSTNEAARRLYAKFGFVEEGRFRDRVRLTDGRFVDDVTMAWFPKHRAV